MRREKKIELEKCLGCKDCTRNCKYNGEVATPTMAKQSATKFLCNNKKEVK